MFVGHLAVAFVARKAEPTTSLVWFVAAALLVDLIWPILLLAGIETVRIEPGNTAFTPLAFDSYPWTHSLAMGILWGAALGALARWRGVSAFGAKLVGALVVSHWILDLVTHRPDLTLWPGATQMFGLGLWNSIPGTFVVEGLLWIVAIALFLTVRRPKGVRGHAALWSFVVVTTVIWMSGPFSPPPPDAQVLAKFAVVSWLLIPWSRRIERTSVSTESDHSAM